MTVKVNLTGSAQLDVDLSLGSTEYLLVKAHVKKSGTAETATQGEQEFRTLSMLEVMVAPASLRETVATTIDQFVAGRDGTTEPLFDGDGEPAAPAAPAKKAAAKKAPGAKKARRLNAVTDDEWESS